MKNLTVFSLAILLSTTGMQAQRLSYEEQKTRNINNQKGYVVQKNGNKIEGNIKIDFFDVRDTLGIANFDLRTAVSVIYTTVNSKGRERTRGNTFRPKNVQYFVVIDESGSEFRYEPVHMNVFGNLMSSTALDLSAARKPYFQKVVYTNGDYTAYFDPSSQHESTNFTIAKAGGKANLFAELLRNGRTTRSFVGDCSVLLDKLEQNQITNCIDGIEIFINLLIECQK